MLSAAQSRAAGEASTSGACAPSCPLQTSSAAPGRLQWQRFWRPDAPCSTRHAPCITRHAMPHRPGGSSLHPAGPSSSISSSSSSSSSSRPSSSIRERHGSGRRPRAMQQRATASDSVYPLSKTTVLVETAMLAAVSGLAYLLSTILKLEASLGYFLPLPVVLAAMRGGVNAGWKTMTATGFLLVVLLGPLRAVSYLLIHGMLAATLASLWRAHANFWLCVVAGAAVRMAGQLLYLLLSSVTMNENLFAIMMSNVYAMLDQVSASIGMSGSPSPAAICCVLFGLLSVNAACYVFLLQVVYRVLLEGMGFTLGPLPPIIRRYLFAGMPQPPPEEAGPGLSRAQ